jgi:hypothetical protein
MALRLQLQSLLEELLGTRNVYFQPPANVTMGYPAIVYNRDFLVTKFADDKPYVHTKRYVVTVIDKDPDSKILDSIAMLPMTTFVRHFTADNLNHDIYNLYF